MRKKVYWPQAHNNIVQFFLKQSKKSVEVIFVVGNHDEFLRECVAIAHANATVDKTYDYTCHTIASNIRQHFGVKE